MLPDSFPEPGPDDGPGPDEDAPGPEQGLFITLPAGQLTLAGFCQGGAADTMRPGPLLGTIVDTVTGEGGSGLPGCSGDQLLGVISGARRQRSRDEWLMLSAVAEFARRAGTGVEGEFAADELAFELHLSQPSAAGLMAYAAAVTARLPELFAALGAGQLQPFQLRMIEEETRYLSGPDAAAADAALAQAAPGLTFGQTRSAARKLALTLDPDLARKRKDAARRDAHVRRFQEDSGNAGMVARELPADEVLASWQHVEQRAQDLRAAGIPGTLQELRVRAYLDLLQERDTRTAPAVTSATTGPAGPAGPAPADSAGAATETGATGPGQPATGPDQPATGPDQPATGPGQPATGQPPDSDPPPDGDPPAPPGPGPADGPADPGDPGGPGNGPNGPSGPSPRPGPGNPGGRPGPGSGPAPGPGLVPGPSLAALVTLTIPLATWQGRSGAPGEAGGYGVVDGEDARDLAAAAAHTCLRGRQPPTRPPPAIWQRAPPSAAPRGILATLLTPNTRGPCDHAHAAVGYYPSRTLTRLIRAQTAAAPPPPAAAAPPRAATWTTPPPTGQGGRTCECGLAPPCKR